MASFLTPGGMGRRTFLQVSAAGVVTATVLGGVGRATAAPYSKFTWISPRGTLEVLDDFGFWIGKKLGYFDALGVDVDMQPGTLMLISDHLNCLGVNPLRGANDERFGPR